MVSLRGYRYYASLSCSWINAHQAGENTDHLVVSKVNYTSSFSGYNPNGTWRLYMRDYYAKQRTVFKKRLVQSHHPLMPRPSPLRLLVATVACFFNRDDARSALVTPHPSFSDSTAAGDSFRARRHTRLQSFKATPSKP